MAGVRHFPISTNMILRNALCLAVASIAMCAAAADIVVTSVSPVPNSTITQFNQTTLVLDIPAVSVEQVGAIYYQYCAPGDFANPQMGLNLQASKTRQGDIRISFNNDDINTLFDLGQWPMVNPGLYTLIIEENALKVTDEDGNVCGNTEMTFSYSILSDVEYEPTPNNKRPQATLKDQISIQFPTFQKVTLTENFSAKMTGPDGVEAKFGTPSCIENILVLPIEEELTAIGYYNFNLATGSLMLNAPEGGESQLNPAINFEYNVIGIQEPVVSTISPAQGVVNLLSGVTVVYNMTPSSNRDCTENLTLSYNGKVVREYGSTSPRVQFAIDNEDPGTVCYTFGGSVADFLTEGGEYILNVPAGFMKFRTPAGETKYSEALTLTYQIPISLNYTIDPIPGSYTELSDFVLTFPDVESIVANELEPDEEGNGIIKVYCWGENGDYEPEVAIDGNQVILSIPTTTERVKYIVFIPTGAFTMTMLDGEVMDNQEISLEYFIPSLPMPEVSPVPGNLDGCELLNELTVTLTDGMTYVSWLPSMGPVLKTVTSKGVIKDRVCQYKSRQNDEGVFDIFKNKTTATFYPLDPDYTKPNTYKDLDLAPGVYAIVIGNRSYSVNAPEGSEWEGGYLLQDLTYFYTILPDASTEMTPEYPEEFEFTGKIESFGMTFAKADTVEIDPAASICTIQTIEGQVVEGEIALEADGNEVTLTVTPAIKTNGTYIFTIPAGMILCNGKKAPEYQLTYSVTAGESGVEGIYSTDSFDIYSIDGKVVAKGADKAILHLLPKGLYIVNGVKVVI